MFRARAGGKPGRALAGGLALMLLACSACQTSSSPQAAHGGAVSPVSSVSPSRNHVPPGTGPLFVSITFTPATTYDQAVALLQSVGRTPYPWTCDDPRTPTPPPDDQLRAAFAASHQLLLSYPADALLNQLGTSAQVLSVDPAALYMCP